MDISGYVYESINLPVHIFHQKRGHRIPYTRVVSIHHRQYSPLSSLLSPRISGIVWVQYTTIFVGEMKEQEREE